MTAHLRAVTLCLLFRLSPYLSACDKTSSGSESPSEAGEPLSGDTSAGERSPTSTTSGGEADGGAGGAEMMGGAAGGPSPEGAYLELGTGFRRFEPVTDGQEVPIIKGIQGGYHVWGSFKGRGFTGTDISLLFELSLEGEIIANADYFEYELPVDRSGDYLYSGVSVIYFENERVMPSSGREMSLALTVTTSDGEVLTDEVTLRPICCE